MIGVARVYLWPTLVILCLMPRRRCRVMLARCHCRVMLTRCHCRMMTAGCHCRVMVAGHRIAMQSMMVCGIDRTTTCMTEVVATAVIVASSAYHMPGMTATIGGIEGWTSKEEVVAMWIAQIDAKVPEPITPCQWAEEIAGCTEGVPLPVQQDIA